MQKYDVVVSVRTEYLAKQSTPSESRYVFAYHISITNCGTEPAKLQTRHWIITDGNEQVQEVKGSGVIGEYPYLAPGESFHYTSGTVMETVVGSMQGSYQFLADDGTEFKAPVRPFTLFVPNKVH
ncbi:Co2+/Mg2+ efflux protein ApaG [Marinomonas sp. CT5]|uniref:Co2+/Mg2+ efflux protein ApaG n=1 Tax=Marinomonas sp. CT5 TaxID=2066133 RepID=UPI001806F910|nr:Co2+/Mg2+ efflux protein ApaG [Marinomonas sp. CT5]NVK74714.1 Co2+/Mg2+ efflux protein ApaG [Oceanospirillaceae bacterium]QUX94691.1 Co2+/Mg2+ efflux protein ApaG [Marinomonas sp. CT5]